MKTYTLAFHGDLMVACIRDGADMNAALDHEYNNGGLKLTTDDVRLITGLTLTDDEPEDDNEIVYSGNDYGWLTDEEGACFEYAILTNEHGGKL